MSCRTIWVAARPWAAPSVPGGPPVLRFLSHWGKSLLEKVPQVIVVSSMRARTAMPSERMSISTLA